MIREHNDVMQFTRDDLERIVAYMAQAQIAGSFLVRKFAKQQVDWLPDGGVQVTTSYHQANYEEVPAALPKRKR